MIASQKIAMVWIAAAVALAVGACATGYGKRDSYSDYGYSDKKISDDEFSIVATGNRLTSEQRVAEMALLRAAHLTQEQGRTHFIIVKQAAQSLNVSRTVFLPLPIGSGGMPVTLPVGEGSEKEPLAYAVIRLVPKNTPPPPDAIDAAEVIAQLGKELEGK